MPTAGLYVHVPFCARKCLYCDFESVATLARIPDYLDAVEREAIVRALERTRHNRTAAAKLLGISFRALRYRMQRLGIA